MQKALEDCFYLGCGDVAKWYLNYSNVNEHPVCIWILLFDTSGLADTSNALRGYLQEIDQLCCKNIAQLHPVLFHDLRATWTTLMLSNGVEPVKVMVMGGWKDMKTMMIYIRKAGVDIRGCTAKLDLHDLVQRTAKVLAFAQNDGV